MKTQTKLEKKKKFKNPRKERSVVLVKSDGVKRGLIGEIIKRFEQRGLKIIALKMVYPTKEHAEKHYSGSREWLEGMGKKTLDNFREHKLDVKEMMGIDDPYEIGKMFQKWNVSYLSSGPVVAMIIQGVHAITTVRKITGNTLPILAELGTIRGDFSIDSNTVSNFDGRSLKNIVHASGDEKEAAHEIDHWFAPEEICGYRRSDERVMFSKHE